MKGATDPVKTETGGGKLQNLVLYTWTTRMGVGSHEGGLSLVRTPGLGKRKTEESG